MSSIYKGLLTVVIATVVTSGIILMTGQSNANDTDSKNVVESVQSNTVSDVEIKANNTIVHDKLSENSVVTSENKASLSVASPPPPPPGPFFYGSIVGEGVGVNATNKVRANHGFHVKKPEKPVAPILSNKPSAPTKPSAATVQSSQASVTLDQTVVRNPIINVPKQVQQKLVPQQINNMSEQELKASSSQKVPDFNVEKPKTLINNIKAPVAISAPTAPSFGQLFAPQLKPIPELATKPSEVKPMLPKPQREAIQRQQTVTNPNIQRPMPPSFIIKAPVLRQKAPIQKQLAPPQPQNIIPSYQMISPTMPTFYYYYPVPNYGYQFVPNVNTDTNVTTNPRIHNNQEQPLQETIPPTMMQNNINPNNNFGAGRKN